MDTYTSPHSSHRADGSDGGFPNYPEADVHFVVSPGQTYELYSRTLKIHSSRLHQMLNPEDAAKLTSEARRKGVTTLFRVELMTPEKCKEKDLPNSYWSEEAGGLKLRRLDNRGRPAGRATIDANAFDAGRLTNTLHAHWDNVLRAMHQQPMEFSHCADPSTGTIDLVTLVDAISGIIAVADYLNCMPCVTHQIDNALIKQGPVLWVAIAAAPWRWADLALRVRSELVFREAVCHLVGRWPRLLYQAGRTDRAYAPGGEPALTADLDYAARFNLPDPRDVALLAADDDADPDDPRARDRRRDLATSPAQARRAAAILADLNPAVRTLVQRKAAELDHLKRATNMRLMGYYPTFFARAGTGHSMAPRTQTVGEAIAALGAQLQTSMGAPLPGLVLGAHSGADARLAGSAALGGPSSVGPGSHTIRNTGASTRAAAYHKDILGWMAVTLFRHWFGQYVLRLTAGQPQLDGGWGVYNSLARGGEQYLGHAGVEGFTAWFPLSAKSRRDFEAVLTRIKDELKTYVEDVNKNRLTMDSEKAGQVVARAPGGLEGVFGRESGIKLKSGKLVCGYLVCTEVGSAELPWVLERRRKEAMGARAGREGGGSGGMTTRDVDMTREDRAGTAGVTEAPARSNHKKRLRFSEPSTSRFPPTETEEMDLLDDMPPPPRKRRNAFGSADAAEAPEPLMALDLVDDEDHNMDEQEAEAPSTGARKANGHGRASEKGKERGRGPESPELITDDEDEEDGEGDDDGEKNVAGGNPLFLTPRNG